MANGVIKEVLPGVIARPYPPGTPLFVLRSGKRSQADIEHIIQEYSAQIDRVPGTRPTPEGFKLLKSQIRRLQYMLRIGSHHTA